MVFMMLLPVPGLEQAMLVRSEPSPAGRAAGSMVENRRARRQRAVATVCPRPSAGDGAHFVQVVLRLSLRRNAPKGRVHFIRPETSLRRYITLTPRL